MKGANWGAQGGLGAPEPEGCLGPAGDSTEGDNGARLSPFES